MRSPPLGLARIAGAPLITQPRPRQAPPRLMHAADPPFSASTADLPPGLAVLVDQRREAVAGFGGCWFEATHMWGRVQHAVTASALVCCASSKQPWRRRRLLIALAWVCCDAAQCRELRFHECPEAKAIPALTSFRFMSSSSPSSYST